MSFEPSPEAESASVQPAADPTTDPAAAPLEPSPAGADTQEAGVPSAAADVTRVPSETGPASATRPAVTLADLDHQAGVIALLHGDVQQAHSALRHASQELGLAVEDYTQLLRAHLAGLLSSVAPDAAEAATATNAPAGQPEPPSA